MKRPLLAVMVAVVALLVSRGAALAQSGTQTFVLYQAPGQEHFTVYAAGPISGVGTDFLVGEAVEPGTGRTRRRTETVFPGGSTFNTLTVLDNQLASIRVPVWPTSRDDHIWRSQAAQVSTKA